MFMSLLHSALQSALYSALYLALHSAIVCTKLGGGGEDCGGDNRDPTQTQKRVKLELNIANSSKQINCIENKHLVVQNLDRDCTV